MVKINPFLKVASIAAFKIGSVIYDAGSFLCGLSGTLMAKAVSVKK